MPADLGPWINTVGGTKFYLLHPERSEIHVRDIAWALSQICRFTGHTKSFYSVAQHCVMVSYIVPEQHALAGLLHDAAEAYIGDVSSPLKSILDGTYRNLEERIDIEIHRKFGVCWPDDPSVKRADLTAFVTEVRDLWPDTEWHPGMWVNLDAEPLERRIIPWIQPKAYNEWLNRFDELRTNG